jgi:integrase
MTMNGLRVSEATGANIESLGIERGHRTLVITRKGGKVVTIPLAPRTVRPTPSSPPTRRSTRCAPMAGRQRWTASSAGP